MHRWARRATAPPSERLPRELDEPPLFEIGTFVDLTFAGAPDFGIEPTLITVGRAPRLQPGP